MSGPAPAGPRVLRAATLTSPRLSVVVPSYDTARFVEAALRSLLGQTLPELEVVLVDDGSTDDSLRRVLAIDDPRLTVVSQPNGGLAAARNTGIRHARAPLIGFCDSDDVWHPRKAELQLAAMEGAPEVGVTFSNSAYLDEDGTPTGQLLVCPYEELDARRLLRRNQLGNGSTMIVRAECFRGAGLFDESLASCEDWEMWVRLAARTGCRIRRVAGVLTGYRVREGSLSTGYDRYVAAAEAALERVRGHVPAATARELAHAHAELLRVASRKAFSAGHPEVSRQLLGRALCASPSLPLRDARALVLALAHLLAGAVPARHRSAAYARARRWVAGLHTRRFARMAGRGGAAAFPAAAA